MCGKTYRANLRAQTVILFRAYLPKMPRRNFDKCVAMANPCTASFKNATRAATAVETFSARIKPSVRLIAERRIRSAPPRPNRQELPGSNMLACNMVVTRAESHCKKISEDRMALPAKLCAGAPRLVAKRQSRLTLGAHVENVERHGHQRVVAQ